MRKCSLCKKAERPRIAQPFFFFKKTTRLHNAVGLITDKAGHLLSLSSEMALNHHPPDTSETVLLNAIIECVSFYDAGYYIPLSQ